MHFPPLSEDEIQQSNLLPDGEYPYEVVQSEEKISQAGNEYISLTLQVWDAQNKGHKVFTNLSLIKLVKHFCDVNGMQNEYSSGTLSASNCLGVSGGLVCIGFEGEKVNPKGGMFKAKNIVKDYILSSTDGMKELPKATEPFISDEIPF